MNDLIKQECKTLLSNILRNNSIGLSPDQQDLLVIYVATVKDAVITGVVPQESPLIPENIDCIVRLVQPLGTASKREIRGIVDTMVTEILKRDIKI